MGPSDRDQFSVQCDELLAAAEHELRLIRNLIATCTMSRPAGAKRHDSPAVSSSRPEESLSSRIDMRVAALRRARRADAA
jgi:hypothetical protein